MAAVKIYQAANARLIEIWEYTEERWGAEQADRYIRELVITAQALPDRRRSWRPVRHRSVKEFFYVRHRHHYIFFRSLKQGNVGVVSILHESMDIPSRLREDAEVQN